MNKTELNNILDGLRSMYGNDKFPKLTEFAMDMWFESMKDLDYKQTKVAIANYIKVGKFPPTVADIREHYQLIDKQEKSKGIELAKVFKEMRDYYPGGSNDLKAEEKFMSAICEVDVEYRITYANQIRNKVLNYIANCEQGAQEMTMTLSECICWAIQS